MIIKYQGDIMDMPRVIITGVNRGLGRDVLNLLLSKNPEYFVIGTARTNIEDLQKQINEQFPENKAKIMKLDIQVKESIESFVANVKGFGESFDALINNSAVGCDWGDQIPSKQLAKNTLEVNVLGTISLTQQIMPLLKDNGRIINVSSKLAALKFQGSSVVEKYSNPNLNLQDIQNAVTEYIEGCKNGKLGDYYQSAYGTSKMLLNAWSRFILSKEVKPNQIIVSMSPGHCKTDMGGQNAVRTSVEGATLIYNHLWGNYSANQFYHSMNPYNFYDCGPHPQP